MNKSEKLIKLIEIYPPCKKNDPRPECHRWWGWGGGLVIGRGGKGPQRGHKGQGGHPGGRPGGGHGGHGGGGHR